MAEVNYLTKNGVKRIVESGRKELKDNDFILQIVELKDFSSDEKKKSIALRLVLSDGIASVTALVNRNAYEEVKNLDFKVNSIILIKEFKINQVKGKNILIIEKPFKLLGYCSVLGNPKNYEKLSKQDFTQSLNLCFKTNKENESENIVNSEIKPEVKPEPTPKKVAVEIKPEVKKKTPIEETKVETPKIQEITSMFDSGMRVEEPKKKGWSNTGFVQIQEPSQTAQGEYTPIAALNPMNSDWVIKARVTKKSAPRHWKSFRGEGDLLNIELKDEDGTLIQGTFFNKHVDQFKDKLQEGKVYAISHGSIKPSNARYSSLKHAFCISFNGYTKIVPLEDDGSIEQDGYCYTTLNEASKLDQAKIIDVKGVVVSVEDMDEITMKNGMTKPIRRVIIADNSRDKGLSMQVTFWGKISYKADFTKGEVVALKDAKVGTYNGVSLNMSDE